MQRVAFGSRMREIDSIAINERGIQGITLMENAGTGLTDVILESLNMQKGKNCVIVCGAGNNGGDGYVAGRLLRKADKSVKIYSVVNPEGLKGDAKTNYYRYTFDSGQVKLLDNQGILESFRRDCMGANVIVDAVLGTGISRPVGGLTKRVIDIINECSASIAEKNRMASTPTVISVDIPSGVGADDGKIYGAAIRAHRTVTFQMNKVGMCVEPGRSMAGEVKVINIGIPKDICEEDTGVVYMLDREAAIEMLPKRTPWMNKGDAGKVLIVAGSPAMPGAAALAAKAAYRSGAGLVTVAAAREVIQAVNHHIPEATGLILSQDAHNNIELISEEAKKYDAILVGPGLGQSKAAAGLVKHIIRNIELPLLLDADGINVIAENPDILRLSKGEIVMTPHPGEMGRLIKKTPAEVNESRLDIAQSFAKEYNVTLILKGAASIIARPKGVTFINPTGNSAMATAGSGDVLSGITAAFLAAGLSADDAGILGTYIHGMSGDMCAEAVGEYGTTASDIAMFAGLALKKLTNVK